ncbi:alpha-D-ribose 1-methylphosphonate 5-triphosphate diphosphatase [Lysobacter sp. K5869]|uniref:alpha-D-ribose 1-methylphosphonate 5-triphosphate diphosphatase n=1 Tax=Lysobacter sp. K5869 TaxID=2820808 RepID=UPI001C05F809|nr:alpha-D-ribose 1-methylphosphonate 5-triphosphate diphosphatase [Lysobacter sp. K5869]QWP76502.1 alpha-D-ribose 1-methylphosphonate 5-triphosphate diphosphatase [Lysobacter sp. K5869]
MTVAELLLDNARLVLPDRVVHGHLRVAGGRVLEFGEGRLRSPSALDCGGDYLLPGLVELHTDNLEKHLLPRPGAHWPAAAAVRAHDAQLLASGITTALNAISVGEEEAEEAVEPRGVLAALAQAREDGALRIEHGVHLRCELPCPDLPQRLQPLLDTPQLRLLSLMDHTPGQRQFHDLERYRAYAARHGNVRDDGAFQAQVRRLQDLQHRHAAAHRRVVLALARERGLPLASHDDSDLAHVAEAVEAGARIAEFPVNLATARAARAAGLSVLAGAPNLVRGGSHSGNVAAIDLARAGALDALSSDYVPASLLLAAFQLGEWDSIGLPRAVAMVTRTPARAAGFEDRGELAAGQRADLLRVRVVRGLPLLDAAWVAGERRY